MDKIAAYEMILEDHPLWTKEASLFGRLLKKVPRVPAGVFPRQQLQRYAGRKPGDTRTFFKLGRDLPPETARSIGLRAKEEARKTGKDAYDIYERLVRELG